MTRRATAAVDPRVIDRLDRAFLRMRRITAKPAGATLPIRSVGRTVDLAKVMACVAISDCPAGAHAPTVKDIAAALELDHSTASRLLGEAEAEGLVARGTDPEDRRRTTLSLTDTGRAVVRESADVRNLVIGRVLGDWDPADLETLADLLERISETFRARLPEAIARAEAELGLTIPEHHVPPA